MKLKEKDFEIISQLIANSANIAKMYGIFLNGYMPKTIVNVIRELINKEKKLIKSLELTSAKFEAIKKYFAKNNGIFIKDNMPVLAMSHIDMDNYPYYRIIKRCRYNLMTIDSRVITIDSVRREIMDLETGLVYNSINRAALAIEDKSISLELKQKALFSLLDSPSVELQVLDNDLESINYVTNAIRMVVNYLVDKQAELISKVFEGEVIFEDKSIIDIVDSDEEDAKEIIEKRYADKRGLILLVDADTYDIRYDEVIGDRFDEAFERTYKTLEKEIRMNPNYLTDVNFHIILSYLKVLAAILPLGKRKIMYDSVQEHMESANVFEKYKSLYEDAINDIENNMLREIQTVSIKVNHNKR